MPRNGRAILPFTSSGWERMPAMRAETETAGLRVRGLRHAYGGTPVVEGVGLDLRPGEVHCLMGPSGCGKTTTLRLVAGLEPLQEGFIALDGTVLADGNVCLPPERRTIGLMFQDLALFPHLSVAANVGFGLHGGLRGSGRAARDGRVRRLLDMVGMARHAEKYPHQLSGGEQQRVALARALAPSPHLMLLDEAFSALDVSLRAAVREEALDLLREAGVPTLLVTHDPEEAIAAGDRVHVMQGGRIVQAGTPDDLYEAPANEFIAGFFGSTLRFSSRVRGGLVKTPLGMVAAPAMPDDAEAIVVFRADAVRLRPDYQGNGQAGHVVGCRRLGPACSISLKLDNGAAITLRKPIETPHRIGMRMGFDLDGRFAFVYPGDPRGDDALGDPCLDHEAAPVR